MPKIRLADLEARLMEAELLLDGLKSHSTMRKESCALYDTDILDHITRPALTAVRGARDILRNDIGSKQWTLTTRGGSNRHKELPWDFNIRRKAWKCPCCNFPESKIVIVRKGDNEALYTAMLQNGIRPDVAAAVTEGADLEDLADL